jgi:hypothetical protein
MRKTLTRLVSSLLAFLAFGPSPLAPARRWGRFCLKEPL